MFASLPVVSAAWVCAALLWPPFYQHLAKFDGTLLVASIAGTLLISYWINRQFKKYASMPHAADEYRSPARRRVTQIVLMVLPIAWLCVVGIALRLMSHM
jgi:hypothetical protein